MTDWLCPNITTFSLLNNPETYRRGKSFKLVIDFCDPTSTTSPTATCIADEQARLAYLKLITVQSKVVSQFFSPSIFSDTQ